MPLTDTIARNAKPAAKTVRTFDGDGLYLEVSPRGGKWWRLKYRYAGKEKRVSLGVYPEVNLKKARARTIEARQLLDAGVDPSENRRAAKAAQVEGAANSFEAVAREWIDQQMKSWVKGHGERILTRFERDIFPWIGARPIADLTAPESRVRTPACAASRVVRAKSRPKAAKTDTASLNAASSFVASGGLAAT